MAYAPSNEHGSNPGDGASWNQAHTAPTVPRSTIPPPPPLPPAPQSRNTNPSIIVPPPPALPLDFGHEPVDKGTAKQIMMSLSEKQVEPSGLLSFPSYMFFYGSLMDPEVLQAILGLPKAPVVKMGTVTGFSIKMWGIYPALIPCNNGEVNGTVWEVTSEAHFRRLADYETSAYTWCKCNVNLEGGRSLPGCHTFCWAGDINSKDLEEGEFDFERYQKYFKPSVLRRPP